MEAILFALLAFTGWGVGDFLSAILVRKLNTPIVAVWGFLLRFALYTLAIPLFLNQIADIEPKVLALNLGIGISWSISYVAFYGALKRINPAIAGTIAGSWGALAFLLSLVFLNEIITLHQLIAIIVIFSGVLLSTIDTSIIKRGKKADRIGLLLSFIAMFGWAICGSFIKIPAQTYGWFWTTYFLIAPFTAIIVYYFIRQPKSVKLKTKSLPALAVYALLIGLGESSYNIGIEKGLAAIVAPVAGSYVTLFVLLAFLFFKDPLTRQQKAGVITITSGIILLSIFTS